MCKKVAKMLQRGGRTAQAGPHSPAIGHGKSKTHLIGSSSVVGAKNVIQK